MTKRNTQQRRHTILSQVNEYGEVAVEALAEQFQTSESNFENFDQKSYKTSKISLDILIRI